MVIGPTTSAGKYSCVCLACNGVTFEYSICQFPSCMKVLLVLVVCSIKVELWL